MSRKAPKRIKMEKETIERLEEIPTQIEEKVRVLDRLAKSFRDRMTMAYKQDIVKNCKENMERGRMLLVRYIDQMNKRPKIEPSEESPMKEEMKPMVDEQNLIRVEDESREEKIKDEARVAEQNIPDIIKPKKTGYRNARPDELLFSAHGTPISIEQPGYLMKNLQSMLGATAKKKLDYDNPLGNDISEVD